MPISVVHDLIVDIHALDRELQKFEEKYSIFSEDFYTLYESGRLRDEEVEEADEYGRWAALYTMRQRRKQRYEKDKSRLLAFDPDAERVALTPPVRIEIA